LKLGLLKNEQDLQALLKAKYCPRGQCLCNISQMQANFTLQQHNCR